MIVTFRPRASTRPRKDLSESASSPIDSPNARDARSLELHEPIEHLQLEQANRKATAQIRRSVTLSNSPEDGLHSLISGRRVSPSLGRFFVARVSRCHQRS
jgi:hypothetical protein